MVHDQLLSMFLSQHISGLDIKDFHCLSEEQSHLTLNCTIYYVLVQTKIAIFIANITCMFSMPV